VAAAEVAAVMAVPAVAVVVMAEEEVAADMAVAVAADMAVAVASAARVPAAGKIAATAIAIQLQLQPLPLQQIPGAPQLANQAAMVLTTVAAAAAAVVGIAQLPQPPVKIGVITAALKVEFGLNLAALQRFGEPFGCFC
jgi:hypothetical protein